MDRHNWLYREHEKEREEEEKKKAKEDYLRSIGFIYSKSDFYSCVNKSDRQIELSRRQAINEAFERAKKK